MNIKKNKKLYSSKEEKNYRKYLQAAYPINTIFISFLQKIEIPTEKTY